MTSVNSNTTTYSVGDLVVITKNREGVIRYKGPVQGHSGTYYGIELTVGTGDTDGFFAKKQYFKCPKKKGKFIPLKSILSVKKYSLNKSNKSSNYKPPRKKRKIITSTPSDTTHTSDNSDNYNAFIDNDNDEYDLIKPNSRKRARTRTRSRTSTRNVRRTYSRSSSSKHSSSIKSDTDPFTVQEDDDMDDMDDDDDGEEYIQIQEHSENNNNNNNNYENDDEDDDDDNELNEKENINNSNIEQDDQDDDVISNTDLKDLKQIIFQIEACKVNDLKLFLKILQNLTNNNNKSIFNDCSPKRLRKNDLIKKCKNKINIIYNKNIQKYKYSNNQYKEWKNKIKSFFQNQTGNNKKSSNYITKSPSKSLTKSVKKTQTKNKNNNNNDDNDNDDKDDGDDDQDHVGTQIEMQQDSGDNDDDNDNNKRKDNLPLIKKKINKILVNKHENIENCNMNGVTDISPPNQHNSNPISKDNLNLNLTSTITTNQIPNPNINPSLNSNKEDVISIDFIIKSLNKFQKQNKNNKLLLVNEAKEAQVSIEKLNCEIVSLRQNYLKEIEKKENKITKLIEKNKRRKKEIFVLKKKNENYQKTNKQNEELLQQKNEIIQQKENQNKKFKKIQKESKELITKQQNEIIELKIYKELYDNDQISQLTQNVNDDS